MLKKIFICFFSLVLFSCNNEENNPVTKVPEIPTVFTPTKWTKGTGTISDPYQIETAEHLVFLSETVNEKNLTGDVYDSRRFFDKYFKIINDIDLKNIDFVSIGRNVHFKFKANLDGNFKSIFNLTIKTTNNQEFSGLFGCTSGSIKNLSIVNGNVEGFDYVGGFAGEIYGGTKIENCHFSGTVRGNNLVGGIIGHENSNASQMEINDCSFTGKVLGKNYIGGIAGIIADYAQINRCVNSGEIEGEINIGGIAGQKYRNVINQCFNTGKISANVLNAGGIVGSSSSGADIRPVSQIINCYNKGEVFSTKNASGILGFQASSSGGNVYNSYNIGKITPYDGEYSSPLVTGHYPGTDSDIENCYFLNTTINRYIEPLWGNIKEHNYMITISFVNDLNKKIEPLSWKLDKTSNINEGYPILSWQ